METSVHRHNPPRPAATGHATIRLATVVSVVAAVLAVVLRTFTDVSEPALVVAVMIVAFSLSWHATWRDEFTGS
jgi:4-hydroxybenzoate polyprenyltransferase